jgi:hypothetical protein
MDAGVFELKIQLLLVGKQCQFQCGIKVWLKVCSQTFIPPLKLWLKVCSQTFIPPWKFTLKVSVKVSGPLESFNWNFQPCILATIVISIRLKVSLKLSLQNFKGVWKFDWNFQCKLSRLYESLTANFQPNFQGGMKVWLQTFNQSFKGYASLTAKFQSKFQGVCKFDCKCSTKLSMQSQKNIKDVQICWLFLFETKAIHQDLYNFFLITMIKCIIFWLRSNKPTRVCICGSHESNPTAAK